ncbi:hypothetical protein ACFY7F_36365 [Streptomyces griseofuscus]|uniref:hypothetical protein n=1 Tax=Streptomyces griseofuscus TaxID=146922 RepID=UPI0036AEAC0F
MLDLMAALQKSVAEAKASRGEDTAPGEVHELPVAKKKTSAKKQSARKTATKEKTTAKKTSGRRPRSAWAAHEAGRLLPDRLVAPLRPCAGAGGEKECGRREAGGEESGAATARVGAGRAA